VDLLHKAMHGFATGAVADALAARTGLGPGQRHAALHPGRRLGRSPATCRRFRQPQPSRVAPPHLDTNIRDLRRDGLIDEYLQVA
jgi:hypothetical protein